MPGAERTAQVDPAVELAGETIHAAREIIVSSGTVGSPKLLMHSGIGPADHLTQHGIAPVLDLPVGNNLIDHLLIGIVYTSTIFYELMERLAG